MKDFKYKTKFTSIAKALVSEEKDKYLAKASLDDLKKKLPEVDIERNVDLVPFSCQLYNANRSNKNYDLVDTQTALSIKDTFINKPYNLEHKKTTIVGTILSTSLSAFATGDELTEEDVKEMTQPFSVNVGGVVWRRANEQFAEMLEESNDETSPFYGKIFSSFEVGFNDFDLVLAEKGKKNLEDAEIISDKQEVNKILTKLGTVASGEGGKLDNTKEVFRLLKGETLGLAAAFVENPAYELIHVVTKSSEDNLEENQNTSESNNKKETKTKNNSKKSQKSVKRNKTMEIKSVKDITNQTLQEVDASEVRDSVQSLIDTKLQEYGEQYTREKEEKDKEIQSAKQEYENLKAEYDKLKQQYDEVNEQVQELQAKEEERSKQELYDSRMNELEQTFDLSDSKTRELIANRLYGMSDEDYKNYREELDTLLHERKHEVIAERKKEQEKKETTSSEKKETEENKEDKVDSENEEDEEVEEAVSSALKKSKDSDDTKVPSSVTNRETLKDRYRQHFSKENWKVKFR